jgi:hypothetical protein
MIDDICDFLETNEIGTVATDIFNGELSLDVDNCIAVMASPSPEPNLTLDVFDQVVDFWGRNKSAKSGYDKMKEIKELFDRKHHYIIGDYYVYFSHCLGLIDDNDRDINRRKLYKLSVNFTCRLKDLVS